MYSILHIPSGSIMVTEKETNRIEDPFIYIPYICNNKKQVIHKLNVFITNWPQATIFTQEEISYINTHDEWYDALNDRKYHRSEFEIIKV